MIKKNSYERRVYESVDDNSLSKVISQKTDEEKNKTCNKGLSKNAGIKRKVTVFYPSKCFFSYGDSITTKYGNRSILF